ncbi:MAG: Calx-beta domain-containing protein, partial [Vicinamibacterales bacterium]
TISRAGDTTLPLSVSYTLGGNATHGTDYSFIFSPVTIPAGQASTTVTVTPILDASPEGPQTVVLTLTATVNHLLGTPAAATVTIADNSPTVTVVATDAQATEGGSDTGTFTFTRTGGVPGAVTVNFTHGGSATPVSDYTDFPLSVTIPAGQTSATVTVTALVDTLGGEGPETVQITLGSGSYFVGAPANATVTINNSAPTLVTVVATDPNASEVGADTGTFTISRTGDTALALQVSYTLSGTATRGPDYNAVLGPITIPAGQASTTVTVTPILDALGAEGAETVVLTATAAANYSLGTPASATVTITDSPQTVTVVATDPNASEIGPDTGTFTISRAGDTTFALQVTIALSGTAFNGSDYNSVFGPFTILAGQTSTTVTVTPILDAVGTEGPTETVVLTLPANANYIVGTPSSATVAIADSSPIVTIVATDAQSTEDGPDTGTFTISRTGSTAAPLTVFFTRSGSATPGLDFTDFSSPVSIPGGQVSATVTVIALTDVVNEGPETVELTVASGSYIVGAPSSAIVTINNSAPTLVTVIATDPNASEVGADTGTFIISRTGDTSLALPASFILSGSATRGPDYSSVLGPVSIPAGAASTTVTVTPILDGLGAEGPETVVLTLTATAAYLPGTPATATVTIADNSQTVTVVATDPNASEIGPDTGTFTISRTGDTTLALQVSVSLGGTATNGFDYSSISSFLTILAGQASTTVTVTPILDAVGTEGPTETVVLTLPANANYIVGTPSSATVTIADSSPTVTVVATDAQATENGPDTGTFTFTRTGNTTASLTVNVTRSGSATAGLDYTDFSSSLSIPAGQASVTVTVIALADVLDEGPETVQITLNSGSYIVGTPASATVTINNSAPTLVTVVATDPTASEVGPDTGTFTISRTGDTTLPLQVSYGLGGTASNISDYVQIFGPVTIPAGQISITVTVTPTADGQTEPPETVVLTLAATAKYLVGTPGDATVTIQ